MRYHRHWHARPKGSTSHDRAKGDLSVLTEITDGPATARDRNVDVQFTREEVRDLVAALSVWYPDEIMTAGTVIREADNLAEASGYNDLRYGRGYGYLRSQMLSSALSALPSGTTEQPPAPTRSDDDDGFSEDGEFKQ